jgi:hypothetical protein
MLSALSLFIQDGGLAEGFLEPGFGLRSASGEVERRRRGASSEAQPERNAAAEPQTEARRCCGTVRMRARDERALCAAERAWSRGGQGRPAAREASGGRVGHGGWVEARCRMLVRIVSVL